MNQNNFFGVQRVENQARAMYEQRYKSSRINLILVVFLTVINIIMLIAKDYSYFLFSACVPYELVNTGMFFCGMHSVEYAGEIDFTPLDSSVFVVMLIIAIIILALYLLCFFLSKKKVAWFIVAVVMFSIDTALMLVLWPIGESILDILFHGWVIFSLVYGLVAWNKLKKLPDEETTVTNAQESQTEPLSVDSVEGEQKELTVKNSSIIRIADIDVKTRILAETQYQGINIVYRRVKRTNELVINGNVYDEYEALAELPHVLTAIYDGHKIAVGYNGTHSLITVDGQLLAKKLRLI